MCSARPTGNRSIVVGVNVGARSPSIQMAAPGGSVMKSILPRFTGGATAVFAGTVTTADGAEVGFVDSTLELFGEVDRPTSAPTSTPLTTSRAAFRWRQKGFIPAGG